MSNLKKAKAKVNEGTFNLRVDLALINVLRSFRHSAHVLEEGFSEQIEASLSKYSFNEERQENHLKEALSKAASLKELILYFHMQLSVIENL